MCQSDGSYSVTDQQFRIGKNLNFNCADLVHIAQIYWAWGIVLQVYCIVDWEQFWFVFP